MNYMTYYIIIIMRLLQVKRARLPARVCLYNYYIAIIYIYTARTILYCIILAYFRRSPSAPLHIIMISCIVYNIIIIYVVCIARIIIPHRRNRSFCATRTA